ncbi:CbiX/SirB N-terminal domain-containing protein [Rothia sp. HC945]|uniref:sirohydrochlorin chelatase n=1 Tax=Rothia sp. HC945 TaxID=3171170 RepID=UPI003F22DBDC
MDTKILSEHSLIACGHGTRNAQGQETIAALVSAIGHRMGRPVLGASVDVQTPAVGDVVAGLPTDRPGIIMPLLLSTGYHTKVDLRDAAARFGAGESTGAGECGDRVRIADPLGPSERLAHLQARRLGEAGWQQGDGVVMAVVGSSVAAGGDDARTQSRNLERVLGQRVDVAFGAAADPTVPAAIEACRHRGAPRVFVSSYILAPGFFQDRLHQAGADGVTRTLLDVGDPDSLDTVAGIAVDRAMHCTV